MKTKLLAGFFVVFAVFTAFLATPAFGQGNTSILFDGTVLVGNPQFFGKSARDVVDLNQMKAKTIFPGVEVRFNQQGRVTFGIAYKRWSLKQGPEHFSGSWGRYPFAWYVERDESSKATANAVLGTLYVNFTKRGKVRPFVGVGVGYASFKTEVIGTNEVSLEVMPLDPYSVAPTPEEMAAALAEGKAMADIYYPPLKTGTAPRPLVEAVGGLNIYPAKHVVLSLGAGYISGPAFNFGAGFTF